jgi:hypothetical protein
VGLAAVIEALALPSAAVLTIHPVMEWLVRLAA